MPKIILKWIEGYDFGKETERKGVREMTQKRGCRFFRNPDGHYFGRGIGYCDLGVIWSICDGDIKFCEKPQEMIQLFYEEHRKKTERQPTYASP